MRILRMSLFIGALLLLFGFAGAQEPGKAPTVEEQLKTLWEIQPGFGIMMMQVGERFKNLYFAAQQGNWDFARHQAKEIREAIKIAMVTRPKRAPNAQIFLDQTYPMIYEAIDTKDFKKFDAAFEQMMSNCMMCHFKEGKPFVTLKKPVTAASPVLGLGGGPSARVPPPAPTTAATVTPMLTLEKNMDLLRQRHRQGNFKALIAPAEEISRLSQTLPSHYPQYREKADFLAFMQQMDAGAKRAAQAARKGQQEAAQKALDDLEASCQACHDKYQK